MQESKQILELILKGVAEDTPYANVKIDSENLLSVIENFDQENSKFFFMYNGEDIVGFLAGVVTEQHPLWHGVKIASELFWYVHPDHRGSKSSVKLIKEYETWAKDKGCTYVTMAHFSNKLGKKLSGLYKMLDYEPIEVSYIKELK